MDIGDGRSAAQQAAGQAALGTLSVVEQSLSLEATKSRLRASENQLAKREANLEVWKMPKHHKF